MSLYDNRILVDEYFAHYPEVDVKEAIKKILKRLKEKRSPYTDSLDRILIELEDAIKIIEEEAGADLCSGVEE